MTFCDPGPEIPTTDENCPTLATGMVTVLGQEVQLWVGEVQEDVQGPVFFYWHGTGGSSDEALTGLYGVMDQITAAGGLVASFTTTTGSGTNTGNGVWYTGDFEMADIILACAVQQLNIDVRRVFTGGCSAGGLQAGAMVYKRASYLAGAMPNSGGVIFNYSWENTDHVPSVITTHGSPESDVVGVVFAETSATLYNAVVNRGGLAVDCNHGDGHCGGGLDFYTAVDILDAQWRFLLDHPFRVCPDPYEDGLPGSFPDFCTIIEP